MSAGYQREKLATAVGVLATSAEPIQKRLEYAFTAMHTLQSHPFEIAERQDAWDSIYSRMTADKSDGGKGYVPTTLGKLTDDQASAIASDIVELNEMIQVDYIDELNGN